MEQKKVSNNRQRKEKIVAKLAEKVAKSKGLVFTNYQGLSHKQLEGLKKAIKSLNAELVVAKNTLLFRSLQPSTFNSQLSTLQGPTATLFLYADPIEPLRQLAKSIKEFNLPFVKFGILDKQALTSEQVLKLATLPSREVLIMQILGLMQAPIYGLHGALRWNIQKLVMTLNAIEKVKSSK